MGEPYPVEAGDCIYTHIRLSNCPYEARYKSLLDLLRQDISCKKLVRAGYIKIGLRSMHNVLLSILHPGITKILFNLYQIKTTAINKYNYQEITPLFHVSMYYLEVGNFDIGTFFLQLELFQQ